MDISVRRLEEMRKTGEKHTLLDIREEEEFATSSIDSAVHIPMNTLPENLDQLTKDHPIVVMCRIGGRSSQVCAWLNSNGFENAVNLEGGISAWSADIDPSVPSY